MGLSSHSIVEEKEKRKRVIPSGWEEWAKLAIVKRKTRAPERKFKLPKKCGAFQKEEWGKLKGNGRAQTWKGKTIWKRMKINWAEVKRKCQRTIGGKRASKSYFWHSHNDLLNGIGIGILPTK
jgi:hypothetical protein